MAKINIPEWLTKPEHVGLKCYSVTPGLRPGELTVRFKSNGEEYTAFVPEARVDTYRGLLQAVIVADIGDSWLVDLPAETLTS